jgi:uncharacterized membrane protein
MSPGEERRIHQAFMVSLAIKAADAILELGVTVLLALVDAKVLSGAVIRLAQKELLHHPDDRVAAWFRQSAEAFSIDAKTFAVLYLGSHGLIKLVLVIGLYRNQGWAYPVSIVAFGAFIVYQIHRYTFTHSPFLIVLTVFDIVVIALVWHEWRVRRARGELAAGQVR